MSTQAYFRMSMELEFCPCVMELRETTNGDHCADTRELLFYKILRMGLFPSQELKDYQMLATMTGKPPKQAQRVWDSCIRHGVLRKATYGYTARAWMIENGHLGKYGKPDAEAERAYSQGVHGRRC